MIHPREQEVLNILWKTDKELTSSDIVAAGNRLSQSTVQAVLRKLLKEGLVESVGTTHSGNVLSRTYRPTEKSREKVLELYVESYKSVQHIISRQQLIDELQKVEEGDEKNRLFCL